MALQDHKITSADISAKGVQSAPDKLTGTAAENKALFDKLIAEVVKEKLNELIDEIVMELEGKMPAPELMGVTGQYLKIGVNGMEWDTPGGSGDMLRSAYDTNGDGTVDSADTAEACSGNAASADKWKEAVELKIRDADGSNEGEAVSMDGSGNIVIKLPASIKAALYGNVQGNIQGNVQGNAATASKLATARNIGGAAFDGSGDITLASMGAAEVDANGKVSPQQAASRIVEVPDVSRSLALSDAGCMLMARNGADASQAGYTLTIPAHASVAFPIGTEIEVMQYDAGSVTIQAAADVYLYYPGGPTTAGGSISIGDRYGVVALKKIYENHWLAAGCIG